MVNINKFSYNKETKTFVTDIHIVDPHKKIQIYNTKTGNYRTFELVNKDQDSDGDIYGYRYLSLCKEFKLLIIND